MAKVFLCHSSKDKEFVRRLSDTLNAFGIDTWLDEVELLPGDSLIGKLEHGLSTADYLFAVLSPDMIASEWCKRELRSALNREISGGGCVIPILARSCEMPPFLADKYRVDFTSTFHAGFAEILRLFIDRAQIETLPPAIVDSWKARQKPFSKEDLSNFVEEELRALDQRQQLEKFQRDASQEFVLELINSSSYEHRNNEDRERLTRRINLLALAFGHTDQCTNCNEPGIDLEGLLKTLRDLHHVTLEYSKIQALMLTSEVSATTLYECDICYAYHNAPQTD